MQLRVMNVTECPPSDAPSTEQQKSVESFPYSHLIFNQQKHPETMIKHLNSVFQSMVLLSSLTPEFHAAIEQRVKTLQTKLPKFVRKKKTLFLDLDQTLVHTGLRNEGQFLQKLDFRDATLYFNVRPHTFDFIRALSKNYEIVIFTASTTPYAHEFFSYLNARTGGCISACLTRDHCIQIAPGIFLKDLRIITNRKEKDMVLVDNTAYSFSVNVDNGIPIHNFTTDPTDCELKYLQKYLEEMAKVEDVREFNREKLGLKGMIEVHGKMVKAKEEAKEEARVEQNAMA